MDYRKAQARLLKSMNRKLELFDRVEVRRRYEIQASKISQALDKIEDMLGGEAMPMFWCADRDWRAPDDPFRDIWDVITDRRSQDEMQIWGERGGRVELFFPPGSPVVVRLVSFREGHSCFGAAYDTKHGRLFSLIENKLVRDSGRLREFFSDRDAILSDIADRELEFEFKDAICQLVLPPKVSERA